VATPHSHHYQNVRLCLDAGKHVLCEKAFTVNAEQTKILVQIAKEKGLFLMEAVWTRYFPLCQELRKMVQEQKIGKVHRVFADLSFGDPLEEKFGTQHRMVNIDLAGGALLDRKYHLPSFQGCRTDSSACSGHIQLDVDLPILVSYCAGRQTGKALNRFVHNQISDRGR
jgi:hypothetical protein